MAAGNQGAELEAAEPGKPPKGDKETLHKMGPTDSSAGPTNDKETRSQCTQVVSKRKKNEVTKLKLQNQMKSRPDAVLIKQQEGNVR